MPQFQDPSIYRFQSENMAEGLSMFAMGLAKKVLIADNLAPMTRAIFDSSYYSPTPLSLAWLGALSYTFQLYFDFSGYSDMAIGLARMFNMRFPLNFNSPYQARNISDFWRRWHMTLSNFLRDNLYIPLGGNRRGKSRQYANLIITMLLGGLWHGAGWTFVIWGGLHGFYLVLHQVWNGLGFHKGKGGVLGSASGFILTFLAVVVGWVFFRSHNTGQAVSLLEGMAGCHGLGIPLHFSTFFENRGWHFSHQFQPWPNGAEINLALAMLPFAALIAFSLPNTDAFLRIAEGDPRHPHPAPRRWQPTAAWALLIGLILAADILQLSNVSEFLYFRF